MLTRYGGQPYHNAVADMTKQLDHFADSQRLVENYYAYVDKYLRKVGEKTGGDQKWRVALKWGSKTTVACIEDEDDITKAIRTAKQNQSRAAINL